MRVVSLSYPLPAEERRSQPQVIAIGEFDGVHLGHQQVIRRALERARSLHAPTAIMTFHPHPREVLGQARYARSLTPLQAKLKQLAELGVDTTYVVRFDESFSRIGTHTFVTEFLLPLRPETVVVGFDFSFGHRGAGNPDTLCELGHGRFAVEIVRPYQLDGSKVGSTQIRSWLEQGQLEQANRWLGRAYAVRGTVVRGDGRGRTIGFPTANIEPDGAYVLPANGVYAVRMKVDGAVLNGVANIGRKPTFHADLPKPTLEAHLFDFSGDLYGREIELELVSFLREERKFASPDALVAQIREDAAAARLRLESESSARN